MWWRVAFGRSGVPMSDEFPERLLHDWPIHERLQTFELGFIINSPGSRLVELAAKEVLGRNSAGWWECDLSDDSLTWTSGVYRIFGLPEGNRVARSEAVALYTEDSRTKMERLRSYALSTGRGFILDAQIRPADGGPLRSMRLMGTPLLDGNRITHLQGLKFLI
jgi:hypothetical protein